MTTDPRYRELVPLGAGPAATVFAAVDAATGDAVALKVLPGRLDRRSRSTVEAELRRLAPLRDRAPVLVADRIEELADGHSALRMELCTQSLPELLDSFGPLSVPDALALGSALAAALAGAHELGITHGGVTPGNVLFRPSGEPLLADFGAALRQAFPRDSARALEFLAPETVRDGTVDERGDLYGLGAVLYLALSGRSPHQGPPGEPEGERVLRVLGTPVPPLDRGDLPAELTRLVAALLAKDPDARPATARTVAERLDALQEPPEPPAPGHPQPAATPDGNATPNRDSKPDGDAHPHADPDRDVAEPPFDDFEATPGPQPAPDTTPVQPPPPDPTAVQPLAPGTTSAEPTDAAPPAVVPPTDPPGPRPQGEPILVFGAGDSSRRPGRRTVLLATTAALALLAVVAVPILRNRPAELAVAPAASPAATSTGAPTPTRPAVQLELADPVDRGNEVELSWRSSQPLDFGVVVAAEGEPAKVLLVRSGNSYRVPVDPVRRYCFQIQGSDSIEVYESQPKPIRGATCVK
ncbi:protein kinase [Micromonospora sp. NPDC049559]|uniref:protein kinase domain-containing protein n=1 Tax=Micromonospora sp. NPDC049559 TaxID=3155923 RepID=UPI00343188E7